MRTIILTCLLATGFLYSQTVTHTVYFNRNSDKLELLNEKKLRVFMAKTDSIAVDSININGYSDYLGHKEYNDILSQKRADNIKNFLLSEHKKSVINRTVNTRGLGEVYAPFTPPEGVAEHRKVEIVFYQTPKRYSINQRNTTKVFVSEEGMRFNQVYVLEKVHFIGNEPELIEASIPQLEDFYNQIKQIKTKFKLVIKGHICCLDEDATEDDKLFSQALSTARALRIQDYLVKKGIPKEYIEYKGYSFDEPLVYPELTDSDRQINRRVEAIVYK
ncbi:OmpA family protein [Pseudofulvibacter geojedonensis]|uniref:OmpA family protein n=1 Tax=Pseudofulvibacter geojedonensis TaxID=1123758 RepID=A0ABW3HZ67_9FLAO